MSAEKRNKEVIRRYWEDEAAFSDVIWAAFPDLRCEIVEMIAEGDTVATRLVLSGTHSGPGAFSGVAPSGRYASMEGIVIHHLVDGRIVREGQLSSWDWLGFYRQLGAIPVP